MKTIDFKDYEGMFIYDGYDFAMDKEEFKEIIKDKLKNGKSVDKYKIACKSFYPLSEFDLIDKLADHAQEYFEDYDEVFDFESDELKQASKLIESWTSKQNDICYHEINTRVYLGDLIKEIKKELE